LNIAEVDELRKLSVQIGLADKGRRSCVGGDACPAGVVVLLEGGARRAQRWGLSNGLRLEITVVAHVVADSRDDGVVSLGIRIEMTDVRAPFLLGKSCGCRREMSDGGLRSPVTGDD
jgi:hypothetical protein